VGKQFLFCVSVNLFLKIYINNINYKYMHFQEVVSYLQMESSYTNISCIIFQMVYNVILIIFYHRIIYLI